MNVYQELVSTLHMSVPEVSTKISQLAFSMISINGLPNLETALMKPKNCLPITVSGSDELKELELCLQPMP
jgi:hypothetical protein